MERLKECESEGEWLGLGWLVWVSLGCGGAPLCWMSGRDRIGDHWHLRVKGGVRTTEKRFSSVLCFKRKISNSLSLMHLILMFRNFFSNYSGYSSWPNTDKCHSKTLVVLILFESYTNKSLNHRKEQCMLFYQVNKSCKKTSCVSWAHLSISSLEKPSHTRCQYKATCMCKPWLNPGSDLFC